MIRQRALAVDLWFTAPMAKTTQQIHLETLLAQARQMDNTSATYTFTHSGPVPSNNKAYSGMHWTKRKALADKWHLVFGSYLRAAGVKPMERFTLHLRYNSRHDCDNLSLLQKLAVDTMKGRYVPDDTKKHYRGTHTEVDEALPNNTFIFTITVLA